MNATLREAALERERRSAAQGGAQASSGSQAPPTSAVAQVCTHHSFVKPSSLAWYGDQISDAMDVDVSGLFAGTEIVQHPGGLTTIGYDLLQQDPAASIATIVASNSGRPAGACRNVQGRVERGSIHGRHSTQEEDVVSNWLICSTASWSERERLFERISFAWGLQEPEGTSTRTLQGVDYTRTYQDCGARMYADAWVLPGQTLGRKQGAALHRL